MKKAKVSETQKALLRSIPSLAKKVEKNYNGKGTRARLDTAAEKHFFNSKMST